MVAGHFVDLAVFLAEAQPPAFFPGEVILNGQTHGHAGPGEGVRHHGDQGAIPQAHDRIGVHTGQQSRGFPGRKHRGRSLAHRMAGPADGMRRVRRDDLAGHQPVEQHAYAGEVLLDGRCGHFTAKLLNVGGDVDGLHLAQILNRPPCFTPAQERARRPGVGGAGVGIADIDGKEFEEAQRGLVPGIRNQCWKHGGGGQGDELGAGHGFWVPLYLASSFASTASGR